MQPISYHRLSTGAYTLLTILLLFVTSCGSSTTSTTQTTPQFQQPTSTIASAASTTSTPQLTPTPTPTKATNVILPFQLSSDPYQNSQGEYQTEVEPDVFAYGSTIVAAFQVGRFRDIGSANIGWATSSDGGITWQNGFLPGTTKVVGGPYDRITDPVVTYDAAHNTWIIATVSRLQTSNGLTAPSVLVNLSTDGGLIWSKPIPIMDAGRNGILDKDWLVCDNTPTSPYYGHCYAEWDDFNQNDLILMSTSTDGGKTWGVAKTTANRASGLGGLPLVQPNGKVIVPISRGTEDGIMAFTSSNGGQSWSSALTITMVTSYPKNAYYRGYIFLSAGIDGSGKVYLVWIDCRFEQNCQGTGNDLVMTTSTDGITWQPVHRIPLASIGSTINYYVTGLGVDMTTAGGSAHLGIIFYYYSANCFSNCQLFVGFVSSTNGGATWSPRTKLAGPMLPTWIASGNNKVGDYIAVTFSGGKAIPVFALGRASSGGHPNEAIYTIAGGLNI